jgi:hypothetical protein
LGHRTSLPAWLAGKQDRLSPNLLYFLIANLVTRAGFEPPTFRS